MAAVATTTPTQGYFQPSVPQDSSGQQKIPRDLDFIGRKRVDCFSRIGGEEEIRTLDPHVANVMLYQLSYFPIRENGA